MKEAEKLYKKKDCLKYEKNNSIQSNLKTYIPIIKKKQIQITKISFFTIFVLLCLIIPIFSKKTKNYIRELQDVQKIIIKVSEPGEQEIIFGDFPYKPKVYINEEEITFDDNNKITVPDGENILTLQWENKINTCEKMFKGLYNIIEIDFSEFDTTEVNKMKCFFEDCSSLTKITFGNNFKTSQVDTMYRMFSGCHSITSLDLSKFDTTKVTEMQNMFSNCYYLTYLDISNFDTTLVSAMEYLFNNCSSLTSLNVSSFDTSLVTTMSNMFNNCSSLTSLDLKNFRTSSVKDMSKIFYLCSKLEYIDVSSFDTTRVTSFDRMFYTCQSLSSLDLSHFNTELVTSMNEMFNGCSSLSFLDISNFNTRSNTNFKKMFKGCNLLTSLDVSGFNTQNADSLEALFEGCKSLTSIDVSRFDTSSVSNMANMFSNCEKLTSIDISHFITSNVNNMKNMFTKCRLIESLDFSNFNTDKVTNFEKMFDGCSSLQYLDLSSFNTIRATNMLKMFSNCKELTSLDISNFNTIRVSDFSNMFDNCCKLESLDLSSFDSSIVTKMEKMFYNCASLTSLDLSNFRTTLVTNMVSMFEGCSHLSYLNLNSFSEASSLDITNIFKGTRDNLIYCIQDEDLTPNIKLLIDEKECEIKDCETNWRENYDNLIEDKKNDINSINDKCIMSTVIDSNNNFFFSNNIQGSSLYSYDIDSSEELKKKNTNLTFIEFSNEQKKQLLRKFGLDENEKLYVFISDSPSDNQRTATSEYNYVFILENGTQLDLSSLKEDFYVSVTVPIRDLDLANFDYAKEFSENGYDIYDKNSDFYNDVCAPASSNDNDIVLKDRKSDIYPNNVTLCKGNCIYKEISIEDQRIVCECNINADKINEQLEENYFSEEEDDGNIVNYILDNLNYKIFKCYHLLSSLEHIIKNPAFYVILAIFITVITCSMIFIFNGILNIRISMFKEIPNDLKIRKLTIEHYQKLKENKNNISSPPKKPKKEVDIKQKKKNNKMSKFNPDHKSNLNKIQKVELKKMQKPNKRKGAKKDNFVAYSLSTHDNFMEDIKSKDETIDINIKSNDDSIEYNKLPFTQAVREDKRSLIHIFGHLLLDKIALFNLFRAHKFFKTILICQFLLSLLLDFFFNALFYSDEIVSHKYHNNGNLNFIVTLGLSIASNIISSILSHFIENTKTFEERLELIHEIRKEYKYLFALNNYLKFLKLKMVIFVFIETLIMGTCFYYIIIFFIVYSKSQKSLFINYLTSLVEGLIKSVIISTIIVITRKIGICCNNSYIYNTSKYIDDNF